MLSVLLTMLGVQFMMMGLLGEILTRTYHEVQEKPIYAVRQVLEAPQSEDGQTGGEKDQAPPGTIS